jgi:hypothetical protein
VIVQTPAPIFWISTTSDAANMEVFTVIVVALAEFIITRVPASAAIKVCEAVLVVVGILNVEFN